MGVKKAGGMNSNLSRTERREISLPLSEAKKKEKINDGKAGKRGR